MNKKYLLTIKLNVDGINPNDVEAYSAKFASFCEENICSKLNAMLFVVPVIREETKLSLVSLETMTVVYL